MKLTIFGGTGAVGGHVIEQALDMGHEVTAFVRSPEKLERREELTVIQGQLDDADEIARAIAGADAIVSTLGTRVNAPDQVEIFGQAMENITAGMAEHGVRRLVAISGAIVVLTPEDHMTLSRRLVRLILTSLRPHVARAKEREYEVISATDLDWVIVRPPRILPGPATGTYRVFGGRPPGQTISQGDVADLILTCVREDTWVHKAPIPGY